MELFHRTLLSKSSKQAAVVTTENTRINVGGNSFTDSNGNLWSKDSGYSGTTRVSDWVTIYQNQLTIAGTTDLSLYGTERWSPSPNATLKYDIPVKNNGTYTVRLHWCENYIQGPGWQNGGVGIRKMNVAINDNVVDTDVDIFALVGYRKAYSKTYNNITVTNNILSISLTKTGSENPSLNGIELLYAAETYASSGENNNYKIIFMTPENQPRWNQALTSPPGSVIVVNYDANPNNIDTFNPSNFNSFITTNIAAAHSKGIKVLGYVTTVNSTETTTAISNKIDAWYSAVTDLDGIYVDAAGSVGTIPGGKTYTQYYTDIYNLIKAKGSSELAFIRTSYFDGAAAPSVPIEPNKPLAPLNLSVSAYDSKSVTLVWDNPDATASPAPTIPTNLTEVLVSTNLIEFSWTASTNTLGNGVSGYKIYRNNDPTPIGFVSHPTTIFSDTGLIPGTSYTYTVSAFDNSTPAIGSDKSVPKTFRTSTNSTTPISGQSIPKVMFRFPWSQYESNLQNWGTTNQWKIILGEYAGYNAPATGSIICVIANNRYNIDPYPSRNSVDLDLVDSASNGNNGLISKAVAKGHTVLINIPNFYSSLPVATVKSYIDVCFDLYPNLSGFNFAAAGSGKDSNGNYVPIGGASANIQRYSDYYVEICNYIRTGNSRNKPNMVVCLHAGGYYDDPRQTATDWKTLLDGNYVQIMMVYDGSATLTSDTDIQVNWGNGSSIDPRFLSLKDSYSRERWAIIAASRGTVSEDNISTIQELIQKKYNAGYLMLSQVDGAADGRNIDTASYWNKFTNGLFAKPKLLQATSVSNGIQLSFGYLGETAGADSYNISKSSDGGTTWNVIASKVVPAQGLLYKDTDAINGTSYTYKVLAYNAKEDKYTDFSDPASATYTQTTDTTTPTTQASIETSNWEWQGGNAQNNATPPFWGTKGTASSLNWPGARHSAASWTDSAGNLWLFGGFVDSGIARYDDVWKYDVITKQWTWIAGSNTPVVNPSYSTKGSYGSGNTPGGRSDMACWKDANGDVWVFGGLSDAVAYSKFGDLWKFKMSSGTGQYQWAWMGGNQTRDQAGVSGTKGTPSTSNYPGSRAWPGTWTDNSGNLWLFGGRGHNNSISGLYAEFYLNDLWKYNPTADTWTWVSGNADGTTTGSNNSPYLPYGRGEPFCTIDNNNNLWMFGGYGSGLPANGNQNSYGCWNDLWKYTISTNTWTCVRGLGSYPPGISGLKGNYGSTTKVETDATIYPGARASGAIWCDKNNNIWIFGGYGNDDATVNSIPLDNLNDLWKYNISTGNWAWYGGSKLVGAAGNFGVRYVATSDTIPEASRWFNYWITSDNRIWIYGGNGPKYANGEHNNLWKR